MVADGKTNVTVKLANAMAGQRSLARAQGQVREDMGIVGDPSRIQ